MPKYLVDLNPIGIHYQEETTASSPNQAVQNMLYRYLESRGKADNLPYLAMQLQQNFGRNWDKRVADCVIEVYEGPDMGVQAFEKTVNKEHPGAVIADAWKIHHKMKFTDFDKLADIIGEKEALFSVKLDGELNAICYDGTSVQLVTPRGTVRTNMPPTKEAAQLLAKHKSAVFLGELYAVDEGGKPQSYMKASSLLKDPKGGGDNLLRLSVFDVHSIDGTEYESLSIEERTKMIGDIFGRGQTVQPALSVSGTVDKADELWSQLKAKGWEGLVVYFGADMYKAKPIQTYDMVIIAVNKSKFIEQISAVLCAFMDDQGRFRLTGAISGGFSDEERIRLMEWAERNKAMEDDERIWVDPFKEPLVVEIEAIEVTERPRPTYEFKGGKWTKLQDSLGGSLRFPQFIRMRDDKKPTPQDTSIDQVVQEASRIQAAKDTTELQTKIIKKLGLTPERIKALQAEMKNMSDDDIDRLSGIDDNEISVEIGQAKADAFRVITAIREEERLFRESLGALNVTDDKAREYIKNFVKVAGFDEKLPKDERLEIILQEAKNAVGLIETALTPRNTPTLNVIGIALDALRKVSRATARGNNAADILNKATKKLEQLRRSLPSSGQTSRFVGLSKEAADTMALSYPMVGELEGGDDESVAQAERLIDQIDQDLDGINVILQDMADDLAPIGVQGSREGSIVQAEEFPLEYQIREGEMDAMKRWLGNDPTPLDKYYIQALLDYYNRVPFTVFMHYVQTVSRIPGKEGFAMDPQSAARGMDALQYLLSTPKYRASIVVTADELWGTPTVSVPGQPTDLGGQVTKDNVDFILDAYASDKFSLQEMQTKIRAVLGRDIPIEDVDAFVSSLSSVDVTIGEDKAAEADWATIVHRSPYGRAIEASLNVRGYSWERLVMSPDGKLFKVPITQNHVEFLQEAYGIDYEDAINTGWSAISYTPLRQLAINLGARQDMEQVLGRLSPEMLNVSLLAWAEESYGKKIGVDYDLGEDALSAYKKRGKTGDYGPEVSPVRASETKNLSICLDSGIIEIEKQRSPRND